MHNNFLSRICWTTALATDFAVSGIINFIAPCKVLSKNLYIYNYLGMAPSVLTKNVRYYCWKKSYHAYVSYSAKDNDTNFPILLFFLAKPVLWLCCWHQQGLWLCHHSVGGQKHCKGKPKELCTVRKQQKGSYHMLWVQSKYKMSQPSRLCLQISLFNIFSSSAVRTPFELQFRTDKYEVFPEIMTAMGPMRNKGFQLMYTMDAIACNPASVMLG